MMKDKMTYLICLGYLTILVFVFKTVYPDIPFKDVAAPITGLALLAGLLTSFVLRLVRKGKDNEK